MLTKNGCIFNLSPLKPLQPPVQTAPDQNNIPPLVPPISPPCRLRRAMQARLAFTTRVSVQYQAFIRQLWALTTRQTGRFASECRHYFSPSMGISQLLQPAALYVSVHSASPSQIITAIGAKAQPPRLVPPARGILTQKGGRTTIYISINRSVRPSISCSRAAFTDCRN